MALERIRISSIVLQRLFPHAIKFGTGPDEQTAVRDGNARTQVVLALIGHRGRVEEFEWLAGRDHENVAALVHEVDLAVRAGR